MTDLTPEDIAAARGEGDLVALLLMAAGISPAKPPRQRTTEPDLAPLDIPHPGAWPTGTRRAAPGPTIPGPAVDAALRDYRRWLLADRPPASTHCPCHGCSLGGKA
ncbi:hypothetical protein [Streptomyces sp. NPDC012888]|uniref:hypothetical protein n=1 Tax=Streptomyces sp. NPDC012888 TaxID=3364855 RepID=UPI0036A55B8C